MRRVLWLAAVLAAITIALPTTASATTRMIPAATKCANETNAQTGAVSRWCNVVSTAYPQTVGYYGYVGLGGGPCNMNPRGYTPTPGLVGACAVPAPITVWKYSSHGWTKASLSDGTRGYVHPFDATWRWIYVDGSWYAIEASKLTLEWQVSTSLAR